MIVIHEAGGLGEHISDVANRFANLGYLALGVDLYTREGGPPPMQDMQAMMARLFAMSDATALGDLEGAADFLRARGGCAAGRSAASASAWAGATRCCSPARAIDSTPPLTAGAGSSTGPRREERSTPVRPTPPLEMAERLSCPLLAAIGAEDQNPSPELGEQLRERAAASGQEVKVDVYEGAGHAFFADYRPTYRPGPAAKLWAEIVPFLCAPPAGRLILSRGETRARPARHRGTARGRSVRDRDGPFI